ncbi:roundabout-like protein 1 [Plakobranchus ocellatus]|uniref:Roundabout-like protein 1 n=1 Tax=Plakobranchus ocellatus TaxID=259542 RepID=A0AAV4DKT1_9GAST|nr:roundabout-like protein 1 [Plakobranchus ocellatus]
MQDRHSMKDRLSQGARREIATVRRRKMEGGEKDRQEERQKTPGSGLQPEESNYARSPAASQADQVRTISGHPEQLNVNRFSGQLVQQIVLNILDHLGCFYHFGWLWRKEKRVRKGDGEEGILMYSKFRVSIARLNQALISVARRLRPALDSLGPEELKELPFFLPRPNIVQCYTGDTAVLVCGIENLGTRTVIWRRASDPNPLTIGDSVYVSNSRYSTSARPTDKEWLLVITDVRPEDAGVYECQISSKQKLINHIILRVNYKLDPVVPKNPGISVTGTKYVEKGDPIHLVCNSTGRVTSPDNLDWFKDGVKILPSGLRQVKIDKFHVPHTLTLVSVLDIRHSQMDDAGTYVCRSSDLSITSTKVHVLNGTSATDEAQEPEVDTIIEDGTQEQQQRPKNGGRIYYSIVRYDIGFTGCKIANPSIRHKQFNPI